MLVSAIIERLHGDFRAQYDAPRAGRGVIIRGRAGASPWLSSIEAMMAIKIIAFLDMTRSSCNLRREHRVVIAASRRRATAMK